MVKVSVLMPVYKTKEEYLREAISSILNQTFTDFEFLILDDYPTDDREKIVKSYADKRIKYAKNAQNMGISASRNKLIDMAEGEYLAIFDHDDVSLPERLEKQVAYLDTHPEVGLVSAQVRFIPKNKITTYPKNNDDIRLLLLEHCCVSHSCAMVRKSVLVENNIRYEEEFTPAEDYGLFCRLIGVTELYNLQDVLLDYRMYNENTSTLQRNKMCVATWKIRAMNRTAYSALWQEYLFCATFASRIFLFGFLPLFKIVKSAYKTKIYLFGKILILKIKNSSRIGVK